MAVYKTVTGCVMLCAFALTGCGSYKQEQRIETLEGYATGQQVLDMRLARVEDRLTRVEDALKVHPQDIAQGKNGKKKGSQPVAEVPPAPSYSIVKPAAAEAAGGKTPPSYGPRKVEPDPNFVPKVQPSVPNTPPEGGSAVSTAVNQLSEDISPKSYTTTTAKSGAVSVAPTGNSPTQKTEPSATPLREGTLPVAKPMAAPASASAASGGRVPPSAPVSAATASVAPAKAPAAQATGATSYNAALAAYEKGSYKASQQMFERFIAANPQHSLVANSLYWIGECSYSTGQYATAIMQFKEVVDKYPKHAKAAAALLKIGFSYSQLKDTANARFYWEILVEDFPASQPAALAKKRLAATS